MALLFLCGRGVIGSRNELKIRRVIREGSNPFAHTISYHASD